MRAWFCRYLLVINIWTWFSFARDKRRALKREWRLSEAYLLGLACLGGSLGGIVGMNMFRHKTGHLKFRWGLWVILLLQVAMCIYLY